jgi:FMN phosphatase YigB (HAD superfamily)
MKKRQENKTVVVFDMDGVVLDHTENKLLLARKFSLNIKKEETPSDLIKHRMPLPTYRKFQVDLNDNPEFSYLCTPMPGVKKVLAQLTKKGLPYFLVSRRKKPGMAVKILKHHGLWPRYFNKTNAFFVLTPEDKNVKAKELGITHYFDDQQTILDKLMDVENKFLFDCVDVFKNSPYRRIKSWKEIAKLI